MSNVNELVERYVALWNEPSPERRAATIGELWTEDGVHMLEPPQELQAAAAALGFTAALEVRGHEALEARVTRAHDEFVAPGENYFRPQGNASRLRDVVKFNWEMVRRTGGEPLGVGLELLVLDDRDRIRLDYQFIER